jgi:hypothetical protein
MKNPRLLFFSFLLLTIGNTAFPQNGVPDCDAIKVEIKTTTPGPNQSNGSIDLMFSKPINDYKIFLLNAGPNRTEKIEIKETKLSNLKSGFFDFLIIDRNRKGCLKQLTVVLN